MVVRMGWSHPTPSDMSFDGTSLTISKANKYLSSTVGWAELLGDGTVPAVSAVPAEMSGIAPSGLLTKHRHGALANDESLFTLAREVEEFPRLVNVREGRSMTHEIGLDLPEIATGAFEIGAALMGGMSDFSDARLWYQVRRRDGHTATMRGELERRDSTYRTTVVPTGPPGIFDVKITAANLPGGFEAVVSESIALFDA